MDEFFKALRHFLFRHLLFLAGGGSVVLSFAYAFGRLPARTDHGSIFLILAGISYVVGYALQDLCCTLFPCWTTAPKKINQWLKTNPKNWRRRCFRRLYFKYTGDRWHNIPRFFDFQKAEELLSDERHIVWLERIVALLLISTIFAPCFLVSSVLLLTKMICRNWDCFAFFLAMAALIMVPILGMLGWIKVGQLAQYLFKQSRSCRPW